MAKIDFKKTLPSYKAKAGKFEIITLPKTRYLMIDGFGDPNTSEEYKTAIRTLYPVAYKVKFASKIDLKKDYVVPPLEGLWWADDMTVFTSGRDKSKWSWTLMIMQPSWITQELFLDAVKVAGIKDKTLLDSLDKVRLQSLEEGLCVQTLHIGPYDEEAETLHYIHNTFVPEHHLKMTQKHHEVYISDVRKTAPEKLKTILRQPVLKI